MESKYSPHFFARMPFYNLSLAEDDKPLTTTSHPGLPRLELTRMPMGAKASSAALYRAMANTLGDAVYRYALVWPMIL